MNGVLFVAAVLATWRLAHLVAAEDGPWDVVARLRRRAGASFFGRLMDCFYCVSLWIALPLAWAVGDDWRSGLVAWPALSGGAILLERITARDDGRAE